MKSARAGEPGPTRADARAPTGTVTFLFTDIEGSTVRWDRDRVAMKGAVRLHDAIVRQAIAEHDGYVFKTIGDAFCVAFSRPEDAANAALSAQRALTEADFSAVDGLLVRMSLHTGTADERDDDYFGPAVNRVARLLAVAHGGQTLLSGVTADLVHGELADGATLLDLGEHRLKDLARREHVYQLCAPATPVEFPPLRSLDRFANNLPAMPTAFFGREREVAEITAMLAGHRIVTVVGSGGIGKTRTALHVAANFGDGVGDGIWFVELAPLSGGNYLASTIAMAMGLKLPGDGDPTEHLVHALRDKRALLVFDNCEHLIEASARMIAALLRGCSRIKVIATSRQALGIAGEAAYRLPSLTFPSKEQAVSLTANGALDYSALALFAARARAADQRFAVSDENAPIVADICRRLDGIALAIELAAPRIKMLSPRQLRDKLDERFRILSGGNRDLLPRQQTLRALIDWSHDLLDDRERRLFRRLSIFVNGFTLEGATVVACGDDLDEVDVFDLLTSLADKSLVLAEHDGPTVRYGLLESTRSYGREKLDAADERDRCARAHLRFLEELFVKIDERVAISGSRSELMAVFAVELDDVRAALDLAVISDPKLGASLLAAQTGSPWITLGLESEITSRTRAFLDVLPRSEARLHARLWHTIVVISRAMGHPTHALEIALTALSFARESGDESTLVFVASLCAGSAMAENRFEEAEAFLAEAQAARNISLRARLILLQLRANLWAREGKYTDAFTAFETLISEARTIGDEPLATTTVENLAVSHRLAGNTERSNELLRGLLPQLRAQKHRLTLQSVLSNLSQNLVLSGNVTESLEFAREGMALHASMDPLTPGVAVNVEMIALALQAQGASPRAAILAGYASAALERIGFQRDLEQAKISEHLHAQLAEALPSEERLRLFAQGAALSPKAAIAHTLEDFSTSPSS